MISFHSKSIRLALLAAAASIGLSAAPLAAQVRPDPGADLSEHLRTLAESPRNLGALMGAARAALTLGDPQAAITFFARAEEITPRDGRIKAGIASALLQMEQPQAALKFFSEATSLGVPDAEIAADRGLAYDLAGNPARAQLDYALVLRKGPNDEVTRRLALSKAITGDREGALKLLDPQLRQQDRAAWRARAFVLALSGDAAAATEAVEAVMPAYAAQMRPFLARLPNLAPAQRAMAVHFGHFPEGGGQAVQMARAESSARPPAPKPRAEPVRRTQMAARAPATTPARRTPPPQPVEVTERDDDPDRVRRVASLIKVPLDRDERRAEPEPAPTAEAQPQREASRPAPPKPEPKPVQLAQAQPRRIAPPEPERVAPKPVELPPSAVSAGAELPETAELDEVKLDPGPTSFADVAAAIAALPEPVKAEPEKPAAKPEPKPVKEAAKKEPAKKEPAKKVAKRAEPKEPSRHWVQIAGGADKAAMPYEFKRLKGKAPKLLADQSAWTTPLNATNRLLVGPFKSAGEAQEFVNELAKADLSAFSWTSPAGQEIEKLVVK